VVGEGDSYKNALADVRSAIQFHIETFGSEVLETDQPVLEAFIAETEVLETLPYFSSCAAETISTASRRWQDIDPDLIGSVRLRFRSMDN
jgi:hypothetical protein